MKTGKDSVVIGNVPPDTHAGTGSVIIGPMDANGNVILNQTMAIGRGARAGFGAVAVGAFAGAGSSALTSVLANDLEQLAALVLQQNDATMSALVEKLRAELTSPQQDEQTVKSTLWELVKAAGSINGAHTFIGKIAGVLGYAEYFGSA